MIDRVHKDREFCIEAPFHDFDKKRNNLSIRNVPDYVDAVPYGTTIKILMFLIKMHQLLSRPDTLQLEKNQQRW